MARRGTRGIPALVRRVRGDDPAQQAEAALALGRMLADAEDGGPQRYDAAADAMAAAGLTPALVQIISTSQDGGLLRLSAGLLAGLVHGSPRRAAAILTAGGAAPLVQLLRRDSVYIQGSALTALMFVTLPQQPRSTLDAATAAVAAAGAIPAVIRHLSSSDARVSQAATALLGNLALDSPARQQAIHAAGGIPPLVRCLRRSSSDDAPFTGLTALANGSPERCRAIAAAGGASACLEALARSPTPFRTIYATELLCFLALFGQAQAVVAADPSNAADAALQAHLRTCWADEQRQTLAAARRNLAAARRAAQPASAAAATVPAAPEPRAAAQTATAAASLAPPRVCSNPGCGATEGRLNRCAACGTVRYCSQACQAAHWREHRPECKRVRAERAAAAEAAGAAREAGPSRP